MCSFLHYLWECVIVHINMSFSKYRCGSNSRLQTFVSSAAGKTPDPEKRTYIDVMHERDLRREELEVRGKIVDKKKESTAAEKQQKEEKPGVALSSRGGGWEGVRVCSANIAAQ